MQAGNAPQAPRTHISALPQECMEHILSNLTNDGTWNPYTEWYNRHRPGIQDLRKVNRAFREAANGAINIATPDSTVGRSMTRKRERRGEDRPRFNTNHHPFEMPEYQLPREAVRPGDDVQLARRGTVSFRVLSVPSNGQVLVSGVYGGRYDVEPPGMTPRLVNVADINNTDERDFRGKALYSDERNPFPGSSLMARQRRAPRKACRKRAPARRTTTGTRKKAGAKRRR